MTTITTEREIETVADLLKRLGNIPARRVLLRPLPGTATEDDLLLMIESKDRLCELVDGVLVEKPMGMEESEIAALIIIHVGGFIRQHDLGIIMAPDGPTRLRLGLVRLPDVLFISFDRFPDRKRPKGER